MLDQIVVSSAVLFDMGNELAHHIELMIARKDQLVPLQADKLLQNIHHTVRREHSLPKVVGGIAVRVGRVALAAVIACAVAATVERQEEGLVAGEFCGHPRFAQIHTEKCEHAPVETKGGFARVAVGFPLVFRVLHALAGELVFQLKGEHGDAVDGEHHIHAVFVFGAVMPLAHALEDVLPVVGGGGFVEGGFRLKIAHAERHAPVFEPVAQDMQNAVHVTGVLEREAKPLFRLRGVHIAKALPGFRLAVLDKAQQRSREQTQLRVIGVGALLVAAGRGEEKGFNIAFKALFGGDHSYHSLMSSEDPSAIILVSL